MTLKSLSLFVGKGECNANCEHCAGRIHRKFSPGLDGVVDEHLIDSTLRNCYERGARYLSLTGSGEPTLSPKSVTRILEILDRFAKEAFPYSPINMYSNGIRIGEDEGFAKHYLPLWRSLGLTNFYITVHSVDEKENSRIYGVESYPSLERVLGRIHDFGLKMRANIVLSKRTIDTFDKFVYIVNGLRALGADAISAWLVRSMDDKLDLRLAPRDIELEKMRVWKDEVVATGYNLRLLGEENQQEYVLENKLTLFPDGTLSNKWCG